MAKRQNEKNELKKLLKSINKQEEQKAIINELNASAGLNISDWNDLSNKSIELVSGQSPVFAKTDFEEFITGKKQEITPTTQWQIKNEISTSKNEEISSYPNDYNDTDTYPEIASAWDNSSESLDEDELEKLADKKSRNTQRRPTKNKEQQIKKKNRNRNRNQIRTTNIDYDDTYSNITDEMSDDEVLNKYAEDTYDQDETEAYSDLIKNSQQLDDEALNNFAKESQYPALLPAIDVDSQVILASDQIAAYTDDISSKMPNRYHYIAYDLLDNGQSELLDKVLGIAEKANTLPEAEKQETFLLLEEISNNLSDHIQQNALKLLYKGKITEVKSLLPESTQYAKSSTVSDYYKEYRDKIDAASFSKEMRDEALLLLKEDKYEQIDELLVQLQKETDQPQQPKPIDPLTEAFIKMSPGIRSIASKHGLNLSDNDIRNLLSGNGDHLIEELLANYDHLGKKERVAKIKEILSDIETALPADIAGALSMQFAIAQKALSIGGKIDSFVDRVKNYAFITAIVVIAEFLLLPNLFFLGGLTIFVLASQQIFLSYFLKPKQK